MKYFFTLLLCLVFLCSCNIEKLDDTKIRDLPYTILSENEIPDEIIKIINERKDSNFTHTYKDHESLYIIISYGPQPTTGYNIVIESLYEGENAIFVSSMLTGPSKQDDVTEIISYPYTVLKLDFLDKTVIFR